MPGRNEQRGAAIAEARVVEDSSFFVRRIFLSGRIFCFPIFVFDLIEIMRPERPKSPERRGMRGSFTGRLKVTNPRKPARMKIIREIVQLFSLRVINKEMKIKM